MSIFCVSFVTPTLKMHARQCGKFPVKLDQGGELFFFKRAMLVECTGVCVVSLAHESKLRESQFYLLR